MASFEKRSGFIFDNRRSLGNLVQGGRWLGAPLFQSAFGLAYGLLRWPVLFSALCGGAGLLISFYWSIDHPFFDCVPVKTVVAADLEHRDLTPVNQLAERARMNLQILGYFGNRHHPAGRGIAARSGLHCGLNFRYRAIRATLGERFPFSK